MRMLIDCVSRLKGYYTLMRVRRRMGLPGATIAQRSVSVSGGIMFEPCIGSGQSEAHGVMVKPGKTRQVVEHGMASLSVSF